MTRSKTAVIAYAAWAAFALSWFLPTLNFGSSELFRDANMGWKAFAYALSYVIKPDNHDWHWWLCIVGVLSNVVVLLSVWMLRKDSIPGWFIGVLAAVFVLNLAWIPTMSKAALLPGYWLWVGSMGALAAIAILKRRGSVPPRAV